MDEGGNNVDGKIREIFNQHAQRKYTYIECRAFIAIPSFYRFRLCVCKQLAYDDGVCLANCEKKYFSFFVVTNLYEIDVDGKGQMWVHNMRACVCVCSVYIGTIHSVLFTHPIYRTPYQRNKLYRHSVIHRHSHTHANSLHLQETIGCYFKRIAALRCSIRFPSLSSAPSPHSRVFLASNTNSIAKFDKIYAPSSTSTSAHYFLKWNELLISYASHHRRAFHFSLLWRLRVRSA